MPRGRGGRGCPHNGPRGGGPISRALHPLFDEMPFSLNFQEMDAILDPGHGSLCSQHPPLRGRGVSSDPAPSNYNFLLVQNIVGLIGQHSFAQDTSDVSHTWHALDPTGGGRGKAHPIHGILRLHREPVHTSAHKANKPLWVHIPVTDQEACVSGVPVEVSRGGSRLLMAVHRTPMRGTRQP